MFCSKLYANTVLLQLCLTWRRFDPICYMLNACVILRKRVSYSEYVCHIANTCVILRMCVFKGSRTFASGRIRECNALRNLIWQSSYSPFCIASFWTRSRRYAFCSSEWQENEVCRMLWRFAI